MASEHRLGIDINGVIIARRGISGAPSVTMPAVDLAVESIAELVQRKFAPETVYLISKSSGSTGSKRARTLQWLQQHRFYEQTGILPSHVYFCDSRQDKARVCERLQISHFIDDRLEVLSYLPFVPHRYLFQPSPIEIYRFYETLPQVMKMDSWPALLQQVLS